MKSINILIVIAIIVTSCQHKAAITQSGSPASKQEQYTDARGNLNLLGNSQRSSLQQAPFGDWFNKNYADYTIDSATAQQLKPLLKDKQFIIFMGTWCGDSRREVPRIYKILDYCGVKPSQIKLINVSNVDTLYKQSPAHEEKGLYIHRVPNLLVYDNKKEKGRVVESPVTSLEKDLLAITDGSAYTPRYPAAHYLVTLFSTSSLASIESDLAKPAAQLKPLVQRPGELTSFANLLMSTKDVDRAVVVYQINTMLFPAEVDPLNSLASAYVKKGDTAAAKSCCEKVLQIQPGNPQATALLAQLPK
jgi:hypothetical protein